MLERELWSTPADIGTTGQRVNHSSCFFDKLLEIVYRDHSIFGGHRFRPRSISQGPLRADQPNTESKTFEVRSNPPHLHNATFLLVRKNPDQHHTCKLRKCATSKHGHPFSRCPCLLHCRKRSPGTVSRRRTKCDGTSPSRNGNRGYPASKRRKGFQISGASSGTQFP